MREEQFDPAATAQQLFRVDPPKPPPEGDPTLAARLLFAVLAPEAPAAVDQSTQPSPESR